MGQSSQRITPQTPDALRPITNQLTSLAGNTKTPVTSYGGTFANPQTAGESTALNKLRAQTYGTSPLYQSGTSQLLQTLGGNYLNPSTNPYLSANADTITQRSLKGLGSALDSYDSGANRSGAFASTGASNLRRSAFSDFSTNLQQQLAALYGGNYQNERSNQVGALNTALSYNNDPFSQLQQLYGDESVPRNIQDVNSQGAYSDFLRTQTATQYQNELPFNQLMQLLQGYPLAYDQYTPGVSPFSDAGAALGGLGQFGQGAAMLAMAA